MNRRKRKTRKTLAKEIKNTAQSSDLEQGGKAFQMAEFGRSLTPTEELVRMYYHSKAEINGPHKYWWFRIILNPPGAKQIKTNLGEFVKAQFNAGKECLCEQFMSAIDSKDFPKIQEFADAVHFFKDLNYPRLDPVDPVRHILLAIKLMIQTGGKIMTVREIAEHLGPENSSNPFYTPDDGFSALRKRCREICLPLARKSKISRK